MKKVLIPVALAGLLALSTVGGAAAAPSPKACHGQSVSLVVRNIAPLGRLARSLSEATGTKITAGDLNKAAKAVCSGAGGAFPPVFP